MKIRDNYVRSNWALWLLLLVATIGSSFGEARAQMNSEPHALKYFLDEPPTAADLARVPPEARDVVVAKVRIVAIFWLGGRDQSGAPPPRPKWLFGAELEAIEVLSGNKPTGARYFVSFGIPGESPRHIRPLRPDRRSVDYYVVSYIDQSNDSQLAGFPATQQELKLWEQRFFEIERERGRFGAEDR